MTTRPNRLRGWLFLALGAAGLTIGIAVGLRGVRAGAGLLQIVFGLTVLALGIGLVGLGLRVLLQGRRLSIRLVAGTALLFAVALVVWTLAPAVIATTVPPIAHGEVTPASFGMDAEEVMFETADGVVIWAWFVPPANGAAVVIRHGSGSTASSVLKQAAVIARHGYGVLVTDARGHGNSGGRGMDFGWFGDIDIAAAVSFLARQPGVDADRIGVVGLSMGGEEAIGAIGSNPGIGAVVAEGATARTDGDKEWLSEEYGWRGWVQEQLEWAQYSFTDLLTPASKPETLAASARSASPRPILLISGESAPDEARAAAHIGAGADNVSTWNVPGAGHVQGLATAPDEWEAVVVGFLDESIGG